MNAPIRLGLFGLVLAVVFALAAVTARAVVPEETARVWDLYLTGGTRSFAEGRMGVEQFVLRRPEGTFAL